MKQKQGCYKDSYKTKENKNLQFFIDEFVIPIPTNEKSTNTSLPMRWMEFFFGE